MKDSGSSNFISLAISNTGRLIRLIVLLIAIIVGLIFLIKSIFQCIQPQKFGIKMIEAQNTRLYFEPLNNNLEILRLPANLFWIESDTRLGENTELSIQTSGMVSIGFNSQVKKIISDVLIPRDTSYIDFALEFERYLTAEWRGPNGKMIMDLDTLKDQSPCREGLNKISGQLLFLKNKNFGSVIGFVFSRKAQRIIQKYENTNLIDEKIHFIDTMIANHRNSDDMEVFYIGQGADIHKKLYS